MAKWVNTTKFEREPGPYTIVAAGSPSNSSVCVLPAAHPPEATSLPGTVGRRSSRKAGPWRVAKASNLIAKDVSLIIYWPVDDKAVNRRCGRVAEDSTVSAGSELASNARHGVGTCVHRLMDVE